MGNQHCFKATTEYKYMAGKNGDQLIVQLVTAWYTLDIPVGFGPAGYGNLPGLIINLEIGDIIYQMTDLKLNTKKDTVIKTPKLKGRIISESEYNGLSN
ncbi:GLPGLI family protein [Olleya sp. 1-3]|uniref:GLPGLI family protein n=1 Tax=Olleya sp. 1-3 TaxID=2058323 RepID=UPI001E420D54|nr:GLPGLI family protein [Olleya sp. 1-3]